MNYYFYIIRAIHESPLQFVLLNIHNVRRANALLVFGFSFQGTVKKDAE
jgi:hypothetical protein